MEKIVSIFVSPVISDFFINFSEDNHQKILKILVKATIRMLNFNQASPKNIRELKHMVNKLVRSYSKNRFITNQITDLNIKFNNIEKELHSIGSKYKDEEIEKQAKNLDESLGKKSLEEYIYPAWWLEMGNLETPEKKINVLTKRNLVENKGKKLFGEIAEEKYVPIRHKKIDNKSDLRIFNIPSNHYGFDIKHDDQEYSFNSNIKDPESKLQDSFNCTFNESSIRIKSINN